MDYQWFDRFKVTRKARQPAYVACLCDPRMAVRSWTSRCAVLLPAPTARTSPGVTWSSSIGMGDSKATSTS